MVGHITTFVFVIITFMSKFGIIIKIIVTTSLKYKCIDLSHVVVEEDRRCSADYGGASAECEDATESDDGHWIGIIHGPQDAAGASNWLHEQELTKLDRKSPEGAHDMCERHVYAVIIVQKRLQLFSPRREQP